MTAWQRHRAEVDGLVHYVDDLGADLLVPYCKPVNSTYFVRFPKTTDDVTCIMCLAKTHGL